MKKAIDPEQSIIAFSRQKNLADVFVHSKTNITLRRRSRQDVRNTAASVHTLKTTDRIHHIFATVCTFCENKRIYDGVEAETRKSQASFQLYSSLIRGSDEEETRII